MVTSVLALRLGGSFKTGIVPCEPILSCGAKMRNLARMMEAAGVWVFEREPECLAVQGPERGWRLAVDVVRVLSQRQRAALSEMILQTNESLAVFRQACALVAPPPLELAGIGKGEFEAVAEVLKASVDHGDDSDCFSMVIDLEGFGGFADNGPESLSQLETAMLLQRDHDPRAAPALRRLAQAAGLRRLLDSGQSA
jgi:hypothetical protein